VTFGIIGTSPPRAISPLDRGFFVLSSVECVLYPESFPIYWATVRFFCPCPEHRSCHGMADGYWAFCTMKLPCWVPRWKKTCVEKCNWPIRLQSRCGMCVNVPPNKLTLYASVTWVWGIGVTLPFTLMLPWSCDTDDATVVHYCVTYMLAVRAVGLSWISQFLTRGYSCSVLST